MNEVRVNVTDTDLTLSVAEAWRALKTNTGALSVALAEQDEQPPTEDAVKWRDWWFRAGKFTKFECWDGAEWQPGTDDWPSGAMGLFAKGNIVNEFRSLCEAKAKEVEKKARERLTDAMCSLVPADFVKPDAYKERGVQLGIEQPDRRADAPERSDPRPDQIANAFSKQDDTYPMWGAWDK